uniref:NUC173 domain-containing protein n=1 Tax=Panagrellus redivivus TaxID=6233 RepID=A0A7E4VCP7_PANRE
MGKAFRVRVNRKGAVKIAKGQTSSNNAPITRFRDQAKAERAAKAEPMIAIDDREEMIAEDPVNRLDIDTMNLDNDDANTEITAGGMTAISRFTNCTNPTFEPVNRIWTSGSTIQNDVISVLASAVEVIKEKQGNQSDIEYYGVLLSTLDALDVADTKKVYASSYLLQLIAPKVPKELLIRYYSNAKAVLERKIKALANTKEAYGAIKFLIAALGILLKAQPESFWQVQENKQVLADLVPFTNHPHPGVRMMSRRMLRSMLTEEPYVKDGSVHPAAKVVAKAIKTQIETAGGNRDTITRTLCLLEGILYRVAEPTLASMLEILLHLGASADSMVRCSAFQCMQRTLERPPLEESFPVSRNAELILALRSHTTPADISVFAYWLQALSEAHVCLARSTPEKSINLLPDTLDLFGKAFNTPSNELGHAVYVSLNRLITECIKENPVGATKCLTILESSLNVQNTNLWKYVLQCMTILFNESKKAVDSPIFEKVLNTLANLREKDDCFCKSEIDAVIASAIRNVGLSRVVGIIELGIDPSAPVMPDDFKRSWMLPLLANNVRDESINYFVNSVIPVLVKLHERLDKLPPVTSKLYAVIELQIWGILPNLLTTPTDFVDQFVTLAPMIGSALTQRLDLRLVLLKSLRSALRYAEKEGQIEVMKRFAKNYLPILFNIYTATPTDTAEIVSKQGLTNYDDRAVRLSCLETVRAYVTQSPEDVRSIYVNVALGKLRDDEQSLEKKQAIADLVIALVRGLDATQCAEVFTAVEKWFTSNLASFQKKAYRILGEMYKRISEPELASFFEKNAPFVKNMIASGMTRVLPSARGPRIAIYRAILVTMSDYNDVTHFVESILEQVIVSQDKSFGKQTRHQAAHCFLQICSALMSAAAEAEITPSVALEPVLDTVIKLYTKPIEGTEVSFEQARAALIAQNMLVQKFVKYFNPSVLSKLIHLACATMEDTRGAVKILAVRCMRILCNKLEEFVMTQFKSLLFEAIFKQDLSNETLRVRKANRLLLEVLVDRYGPEMLINNTDNEDFLKQIKNISKIKRRRENKTTSGPQSGDVEMEEDDTQSTFTSANTVKADTIFDILEDSDDEDMAEHKPKKAADSMSVFLHEDEDEIVDLLDRDTIIQRLSTKDPRAAPKKVQIDETHKDNAFTVNKEGKIVIVNIDKKRKRYNSEMFEDDDKRANVEEDDVALEEHEDNATVVASTYRPGGKGIHRASAAPKSVVSNAMSVATTTNGKKKAGGGDGKKKGDKFEPYAYIPLRNKGRKDGLKTILKKGKTVSVPGGGRSNKKKR